MKQVFEAICAAGNLASAYLRFAQVRGMWGRGTPMTAMRRNPVKEMLDVAEAIRTGRYQPELPVKINIQKADGTQRQIAVFCVRDRVVQRALLQVGQQITERVFLPSSYGFRPRRGVRHAINAAAGWVRAGYGHAVDADIRMCFDNIPRRALMRRVGGLFADERAARLVAKCIGAQGDCRDEKGLAQGSCLSPWLCNLYLHSFDASMHSAQVPLVRYADDFVLFARSRDLAEAALARARGWMDRNGLELHPGKTRLLDPCDSARFLGANLVRPMLLLASEAAPC